MQALRKMEKGDDVSLAGIPTEASIIQLIEAAMPSRLKNVYCASPGGGKFMAVLQVRKEQPSDEGRQRQMALLAFSAFSELKHVFLVDEDVDPFDMNDVLWAMNTRFQGDAVSIFSVIFIFAISLLHFFLLKMLLQ